MLRSRRRRSESTGSGSSSQLLNLSLFIMLLAFFIVLNALSSYKEFKSKTVIESLETAFSTDVRRQDTSPSLAEDPNKSIRQGAVVDRLDALFKAQISSYEATKSSARGIMHVEMPLEVFSKAVMAVGQEDLNRTATTARPKNFFLPTLISILKSNEQGVPYRMDILFNLPDNPARLQNQDPQLVGKIMARAGALSQQLEKSGLQQKLISIGFQEGDEEMVELDFRAHVPFSPVSAEDQE